MAVNQEVERKFMVNNFSWLTADIDSYIIHQYYLNTTPELEERIRLVHSNSGICLYAVHTIKSNTNSLVRMETETYISISKACQLLTKAKSIVRKKRYLVPFNDLTFEIDQFIDRKIWIIEVELDCPDQNIIYPEWVGRELTYNELYYNKNLAVPLEG